MIKERTQKKSTKTLQLEFFVRVFCNVDIYIGQIKDFVGKKLIARDILTACMYYLIDKKKSILYNQLFMSIFMF